MSTREKVIVAVMVAVVLYGAYDLLLSGGKKDAAETMQTGDLNNFVTEMSAMAAMSVDTRQSPYVVERAGADWPRDPFLPRQMVAAFRAEAVADNGELVDEAKTIMGSEVGLLYTGYLLAGANSLAIINGLEYEVGDKLEVAGGYVVENITPAQVEVSQEGTVNKIVLPLEEPEL